MLRKSFVLLVVGTVIFFLCSVSSADVPDSINYEGKLTTATGGCVNDTVQMTFSIYPDTLGSPADWTETQTEVIVKEGIFNVLLGSVNPIPDTVFDGSTKYLGVQVESDPEMRPLKPMVSVAYAFRSVESDTAEFALSAAPDDDWDTDTSGLNIYRLTGNVGIGSAIPPQYKLDVGGTVQMIGFKMPTDASTGRVLTSDASGVGTWQTPPSGIGGSGTTNYIPKFTAPTTIGNSVIYESGGSIGIGTTIPPTRLSVIGLTPSSGYYPLRYNPGNGAIYFQPSSKRYKRDIQSLEDDFSGILRAKPKSFVDATSGEREIGFIAEEFDALGLRNLVIYLDGQPNGIKYEMISLYLLEVVKELQARNEDLQRRIEALEARQDE